jgi:hypothetical protein
MADDYQSTNLDEGLQTCSNPVHWVEVELVGANNKPIAYERYSINLPTGSASEGRLDASGWIRIDGITAAGNCQITFPDLDAKVWKFIESVDARSGAVANGKARNPSFVSFAGATYNASDGQCCSSIAYMQGHLWQTVWNASQNASLRQTRDDPNCLMPGDSVFIPVPTGNQDLRAVDQRHRYQMAGAAKLVIALKYPHGELRMGARYKLTVDGTVIASGTADDGKVTATIVPTDAGGKLVVYGDGTIPDQTYEFKLGTLFPFDQLQGVQQRFRNLGNRAIKVDNTNNPSTTQSVNGFQQSSGNPATGNISDIQDDLRTAYGS